MLRAGARTGLGTEPLALRSLVCVASKAQDDGRFGAACALGPSGIPRGRIFGMDMRSLTHGLVAASGPGRAVVTSVIVLAMSAPAAFGDTAAASPAAICATSSPRVGADR